jgi:hypothetical protein
MSSIGRITSSIISGNVENTFALANLNFDFTLVKLEAPQEYQGVRNALSKRRVDNAEDGPLHRTARKLGALFEQIIPPIQTLTKAYGIRASEISKSCSMNKTVSHLLSWNSRLILPNTSILACSIRLFPKPSFHYVC